MRRKLHKKPLVRNSVIATVIVGLLAGLAYALLQTQASVDGNTITTGSANLLVSSDGIHYGESASGFNFNNVLPGGYPAPAGGYPVYLKNTGDTDFDLSLLIVNPPTNPDSADLTSFHFDLTDASGKTSPGDFDMQSLIDGLESVDGDLAPGATREYKLQMTADPNAAQGVTIGDIDLGFMGTAHDSNDPDQSQSH